MRAAVVLLVALAAACRSSNGAAAGEEPSAAGVAFEGLSEVAERDLRAAARRELKAWSEERRDADAADAAYAMELVLREQGFAHGTVAFDASDDGVRFRVDEGPQATVGEVVVEGVAPALEAEVRTFLEFEGAGAFGSGAALFRASEIESRAGLVEQRLLLLGYYRVEVAAPEYRWNDERTRADVVIAIDAGRPYRVTEVVFEGVPAQRLQGVVGGPYHVRVPAEVAARIRRRYFDEGRQWAKVSSSVALDHANATAVVTLKIDPGPVVRLGDVSVNGLDRTRPHFVRNRLPLEDGEILAQELIDDGIDNLFRSGLFSAVRSRLVNAGDGKADWTLDVDELRARSVEFELGYGSYELARGAARYSDRNLFGIGRRLELELQGSVRSAGVELTVADPWILGRNNSLETTIGYALREEPSFDRVTAKFDLVWQHDFERRSGGPAWTLRSGYRFRAEEAKNIQGGEQIDAEEEGFIRTAGLFASLRRDSRDAVLVPTEGAIGEIGFLWSVPQLGADLDFLGFTLSAAKYVPLGSADRVLAVGFRFQAREILDGAETLPIQERLFLGGQTSVRSFFEDELGPENATTGKPTGGLTSAEAFVELRRRIRGPLYGALFYDVGVVDTRAWSVRGPPGHALGFGVRYYFPVGPIRLDVGWNPGRRFAADQPWAIHLAFGFSF